MKSGQRKNHKALKVIGIIVGILVALLLVRALWLLYILVATAVFAIKISKRRDGSQDDISYWRKKKSAKLLRLLIVVCPLVALAVINRYRKTWVKIPKIIIPIVVWLFGWFIILGLFSHIPAEYTHPTYTTNVATIDLTKKPKQATDNSVPISTKSIADSIDKKDDATKQATTDSTSGGNQTQPSNSSGGDAMAGITVSDAESVPYDRNAYQPNWSAGGGCDIRSRILSSVSLVSVSFGTNGCTVKYGSWSDPYTGQTLTGNPYQGDGTANDLDIDHIIPLNYVNSHGGYYWSASQKRAYGASLTALNNGVYLAVSASENRKKSDKGPSAYYPPNPSYKCSYSEKWRNTARAYNISLSPDDYKLIASILVSCGVK